MMKMNRVVLLLSILGFLMEKIIFVHKLSMFKLRGLGISSGIVVLSQLSIHRNPTKDKVRLPRRWFRDRLSDAQVSR